MAAPRKKKPAPRKKSSSGLPEDALDKPDSDGQQLADELGEQKQPEPQASSEAVLRDRLAIAKAVELSPDSLGGSWFHRLENGVMIWDGCVVGEVQAGIYLVAITYGLEGATEEAKVQLMVDLVTMCAKDPGYEYRFYDSREQMHAARQQYEALQRLREGVR